MNLDTTHPHHHDPITNRNIHEDGSAHWGVLCAPHMREVYVVAQVKRTNPDGGVELVNLNPDAVVVAFAPGECLFIVSGYSMVDVMFLVEKEAARAKGNSLTLERNASMQVQYAV